MEKIREIQEKFSQNKIVAYIQKTPTIWTIGLIFILALVLRLWQIDVIPGGFSEKEKEVVDHIANLNRNKLWFGTEFYKAGYAYLAFVITKIFGLKIIVLRALSATIGALTVLFLYIFISKWFSKIIAIFSAFLLAVSSFHITISRIILPEILLPLLLLVVFSVLTDAYRNKNAWYFGIAGFLIGTGFYTSLSFLFVPVLFVISGIYFYLVNKKFITSYKNELIVASAGFLASSLPFWVSFIRSPMAYLTNFGFNRSLSQIIMNIGQIPNLLFVSTPGEVFLNFGPEPLLDPLIFVTGVFGFLLALFAINRRKYFFLVFWLILFGVYASLKRGVQIIDLVGLIPVFYVFSALVLDYVLEKWFETFPYNKKARILIVGIIAILFALSGLYNFDRYFVAYKSSSEVKEEFSALPPIPLK